MHRTRTRIGRRTPEPLALAPLRAPARRKNTRTRTRT
jgi:hypothetical protein